MTREMALCAERHYMGSSSSGRYATDRGIAPSYDRLPDPELLARGTTCARARLTRYVREQDVLWWVAECQDAKDDLARDQELLARIERAASGLATGELARGHAQNGAGPTVGAVGAVDGEKTDGAARDQLEQRLTAAADALRAHMDQALRRRQEASRQLRLIGISPKAQARIVDELRRRAARP